MRLCLIGIAMTACLAACAVSVPPGTSDVSKLPQEQLNQAGTVSVVAATPQGATIVGPVTGKACQRLKWDPAPTEEAALVQLKAAAFAAGGNALTGVTYDHQNVDVLANCLGTITAKGTAVHIS